MLRVVVAVALATALLSVTVPALDVAKRDRGSTQIERSVERLTAAVADLRDREAAVPAGEAGARRVVTVRLPARTWSTAGVEYLAIGGRPDGSSGHAAAAWRVAGGHERARQVSGVRVEGDGARSPEGVLVVERPGTHRLELELVERDGRRIVVVRRLD